MQRPPRAGWLSVSGARACTNCQRRKSRCLRAHPGDPACASCTRTRKACVFQSPPDRTPLTRRNLDAAELRVAQLRSLLDSLQPGLDVDAAIGRLSACGGGGIAAATAASPPAQLESPPADVDKPALQNYEWHEGSLSASTGPGGSAVVSNDGMANLLTDENSGYLGGSSGSQLLEEIASAIPTDARSRRTSGETQRPRSSRLALPSPGLPGDLSATERRLIDTYFLHYNTWYPILHERSFRDRLASQRSRYSDSPWRIVFYMVLAIGDWISAPESSHAQSPYYNAARSCLTFRMLESGTLETVQAFLLLGNYLQKRDRPNTAYNFIGLAWRLALGLGLHREVPNAIDTIENEKRRSVFWVIYCFDNGFNITTGRPPTLAGGFVDARLPRNIDDRDWSLPDVVPAEASGPTTYSAIAAQAKLAQVADGIYQEFLLAKTAGTKVEYRVAELMEERLMGWQRGLPAYFADAADVPSWFRAARAIVSWKEQNLRILLWRGSREHHRFLPGKQSAETKCVAVAMQSIHDIATFCAADEAALHQGIAWYATYCLFQAALVLEASYLQGLRQQQQRRQQQQQHQQHQQHQQQRRRGCEEEEEEEEEGEGEEAAEGNGAFREHTYSFSQARSCLGVLARSNSSAKRCAEVLDSIHSRLRSRGTTTTTTTTATTTITTITTITPDVSGGEHVEQLPQPPPAAFADGENEYAMFGNSLEFGDDVVDPTLRMLINPTSSDLFEDMPLDVLLDNWIA